LILNNNNRNLERKKIRSSKRKTSKQTDSNSSSRTHEVRREGSKGSITMRGGDEPELVIDNIN